MMKPANQIRLFIAITAAASLLGGCEKEGNHRAGSTPVAARITSTIAGTTTAHTRASGTSWAPGDSIGITATRANGTKPLDNTRYVTPDGDGVFTAGDGEVFYFTDNDDVGFTAYYSYGGEKYTNEDGTQTFVCGSPAQRPEVQPSIDFLFASATGSAASPDVRLHFRHCMSRIVLRFLPGERIATLDDIEYHLGGMLCSGSFNTLTGEIEPLGNPIVMRELTVPGNAAAELSSTLILPPQQGDAERPLELTMRGTKYSASFRLPENPANGNVREILAGHSYTYNVKINDRTITIDLAVIAPWEDGGSKDIPLQEARTLAFDPNGGSGSIAGDKVFEGAAVLLSDGIGMYHPSNKKFAGWNTLPGGGGEFYAPGGTLTMPAGDLTLYALWSGDGSGEDNPILITDAQGMKDIGASLESMGKHYRLCNDLVLDDWVAIYYDNGGGQGEPFWGTFDGGGHTVTLNGVKPVWAVFDGGGSGYYSSLFAKIYNGEVRRLRVDGQITVDGTDENARYYAGGICGYNSISTVTDCISNVTVTATGKMDALYAGSIAGSNDGSIFNCYATGKIESTAIVEDVDLGGIAGFNGSRIANCAALNSHISGKDGQTNTYIHRITGNNGGNIVNNYASATLSASGDKGLDKPDGKDCDAKPAASWWKESGTWADSYTLSSGSEYPLNPWDFTTTWEVTDGQLPVLRRK